MKRDVSIIKCESYDETEVYNSIKKALMQIGYEFPVGKRVLLKPNILMPRPPEDAVTTHPSIVAALCRILKEKKCKILIGDSDGSGTIRKGLEVSGIGKVAKRFGAEIVIFEADEKISITDNSNIMLKEFFIPKKVNDADIIVNLPKLKTHALTRYTGAVKNIFGVIPGTTKTIYHEKAPSQRQFANLLLDIYRMVLPEITIMDGVIGMEGLGPSQGRPKKTGLILASKDGIALDYAASSLIGYRPEDIYTIQLGFIRGLSKKEEIEFINEQGKIPGNDISKMRVIYNKPPIINDKLVSFGQHVYAQFLPRPILNKSMCVWCGTCARVCPVHAITMNKGNRHMIIDRKKCIKCFCCIELCSSCAMTLQEPGFKKLINSILHIFGF